MNQRVNGRERAEGYLNAFPCSDPRNDYDLNTGLEIVLRARDGVIVRMGVTRTSGVREFDLAVLEAVQRASPFGTPPSVITSPDGNVYLYWEFHRNPIPACSTYFARVYILASPPPIENA